ncbi:MAG: hypothetical protein OEL79_04725 [Chromatiales bacterium]|nr:hypothetical protein [Chromatiales bacterium]
MPNETNNTKTTPAVGGQNELLVMRDECVTQGRMRVKAEGLWKMLDDISTAGDVFKPDLDDPFVKYVLSKCEERSKHFQSDGYDLFVTA